MNVFEWSSLSLTECQLDKLDTSKESNASFTAFNTRLSLSYLHACVSRLKMCFTTVYVVFSQVAQLHSYYVPMCLHNHPFFRVTRAQSSRDVLVQRCCMVIVVSRARMFTVRIMNN